MECSPPGDRPPQSHRIFSEFPLESDNPMSPDDFVRAEAETSPPPHAFAVAVVGDPDPDTLPPDELARLLDLLVNRHRDTRRIVLLSVGGSPGLEWARASGFDVQIVPGGGGGHRGRVKQACELVALADAVVVVGDERPWRWLMWLCGEAGVGVRVLKGRAGGRKGRVPPASSTDPLTW